MIDYLLIVILAGIVAFSTLASCGWDVTEMRNREVWWWTGMLGIAALVMPNHWAGALTFLVALGLFRIGRAWFLLRITIVPIAAIAAFYAVLAPLMQPWMIAPVLWSFVVVGLGLSAWAWYGWYVGKEYQVTVPKSWFGFWGIYDYLGGVHWTLCGQGNPMHLLSIMALCTAAVAGLTWMDQPFALVALPIFAMPLYLNQFAEHGPHQGFMHLGALAMAVLVLLSPLTGFSLSGLVIGSLLWIGKPWNGAHGWWDSHRFAYWKDALTICWWPAGWKKRLWGFGTGTWLISTIIMGNARKHVEIFTAAHNEFVQQTVEHGLIGLLVLCGYLADALWRTAHGGVEGQAVFLMGAVFCSVALVNFPWTLYHEFHPPGTKEETWFGSPSLNAMAFVVAVMAEAF